MQAHISSRFSQKQKEFSARAPRHSSSSSSSASTTSDDNDASGSESSKITHRAKRNRKNACTERTQRHNVRRRSDSVARQSQVDEREMLSTLNNRSKRVVPSPAGSPDPYIYTTIDQMRATLPSQISTIACRIVEGKRRQFA